MPQDTRPIEQSTGVGFIVLQSLVALLAGYLLARFQERIARRRDAREALAQWAAAVSNHIEAMQQQLRAVLDSEAAAASGRQKLLKESEEGTIEARTVETKQELRVGEALAISRAASARLKTQIAHLSERARFTTIDPPVDPTTRVQQLEIALDEYESRCRDVERETRALIHGDESVRE